MNRGRERLGDSVAMVAVCVCVREREVGWHVFQSLLSGYILALERLKGGFRKSNHCKSGVCSATEQNWHAWNVWSQWL